VQGLSNSSVSLLKTVRKEGDLIVSEKPDETTEVGHDIRFKTANGKIDVLRRYLRKEMLEPQKIA
jgi:hypothetical protein